MTQSDKFFEKARVHQFILETERSSRQLEIFTPTQTQLEYTFWLPEKDFLTLSNADFQLIPINEEKHWEIMLNLRREIEANFGLFDETLLKQLVKDIQTKSEHLNGQWFLAKFQEVWVGEIGLIPFDFRGQKVGRVKDVDIIPSRQGKGLGNLLIQALCQYAKQEKLQALCLMAIANDWPQQWYQKLGFKKMGEASL